MNCPKCGTENGEECLYCAKCGTLLKQEQTLEVKVQEKDIPAKETEPKEKPKKNNKKLIIGIVVGLLIIALVIILLVLIGIMVFRTQFNSESVKADILRYYDEDDEITYFVNSGKVIGKLDGSCYIESVSTDQSTTLISTTDDYGNVEGLYIVKGNEVKCISDYPASVSYLSGNGKFAVYRNTDGELYYYDVEKEKSSLIEDGVSGSYVGALSPDGKYFVYSTYSWENGYEVELYKGSSGDKFLIASEDYGVFGISNNAKYIYVYNSDEGKIIVLNAKGEQLNKYSADRVVAINPEEDETIFFDEYNTYLVKGAEERIKVASEEAYPCNCNVNGLNDEYSQFTNTLYYVYSNDEDYIFYLNSKYESLGKTSGIDRSIGVGISGICTADGKTFAYIRNYDLYIKDFSKDGESEKASSDVVDFAMSSKGTLYYVDDDDTLYQYKNGKSEKLADDVEQVMVSGKNVVFFESDESLYYMAGSNKKKVCDDLISWRVDDLGGIYYSTGDSDDSDVYYSSGNAKFTEIISDIAQ